MKKVAGTLKIAQAEFRELEAFSKFSSDLDPATKAVLEKGTRNLEILKQNQFSPVKVEKQIAILYCGTQGLLSEVPKHLIKDFEIEFIEVLDAKYKDTLESLRKGTITAAETDVLEKVAGEVAARYSV
jgi:F-type H+-transporting ATPase subunit alpha